MHNTKESEDIYDFLQKHSIKYDRFDHEPVFSVDEAEKLPPMPGMGTKNLFLRDKKGDRHFLVSVSHEKQTDLKVLSEILKSTKLSFGSPERLWEHLKVKPGAVTLLALINDPLYKVEVAIDSTLLNASHIQCHPLTNDATLVISHDEILRFLGQTGHNFIIIN